MIKKNLYLRDLLSRDPFLKKSYEYFSSLNQDIYLVGGYIRDYLLGREVTDIDFVSEVDGNVMAKKLADYFSEPYYSLDKARGVGRVVLKKCKRTIDFSISKQPIENDLKNRDFSINALAVHLLPYSSDELRIIDVSCGLKDLEKKEQKKAAKEMGISQPTFHRLVLAARKKVADALVNNKTIEMMRALLMFRK